MLVEIGGYSLNKHKLVRMIEHVGYSVKREIFHDDIVEVDCLPSFIKLVEPWVRYYTDEALCFKIVENPEGPSILSLSLV